MASGATAVESQLQRIIRDLHDSVAELAKECSESGEPVTDDSTNLHKFSYKLEYLLQFGQKEKTTLLGTKKDYWDYFVDCLAKIKGANDGIRFVKSITELKTSVGKGRAFIRYSLVHQRLADTLQQCLMNQRVTSDWYYSRSPFLKAQLSADIISHLYELNDVQFDVASRGHDLDAAWPTFARRALNANSPSHTWKPPSRSSSINSLASNYSQQPGDFSCSIDFGHGLLNELNESLPPCSEDASTIDELRLELDQSELKMRELLNKVQQMAEQEVELRGVVEDLQRQLDISLTAQENQQVELKNVRGREDTLSREIEAIRNVEKVREAEHYQLQEKMAAAESKNIELLAKLDGVLNEKGHQAASFFDSAQKIHELLDKLKEAEKGKMDAVAEMEEKKRLNERLEEELKLKTIIVKDCETKLEDVVMSKAKLDVQLKEQKCAMDNLQGALMLKEKETSNLQMQLLDLQKMIEKQENEMKKTREKFEKENCDIKEQLESKGEELVTSVNTLQELQTKNQVLTTDKEKLTTDLANMEMNVKEHAAKNEEYKVECGNLMEFNEKLQATVRKNEEQVKEMMRHQAELEAQLAGLRASEKQLRGQLDDTKMTVDEKEKRLREENRELDEHLQRANMAAKMSESTVKRLEQDNQALKEEQKSVNAALSRMQADLKHVHGQISGLENNLEASHKKEQALHSQLQTSESQLDHNKKEISELVKKVKILERNKKELEKAKADAEATIVKQMEMMECVTSEKQAIEKSQFEKSTAQAKQNQEVTSKLNLVEEQLDVSMKEVSRLQAEILDLRVQVQRSEEEKLKSQAQLEMTEAQRNELRTLTEKLKATIEALNQKHVEELMECKKKEEALIKERDKELGNSAELASTLADVHEEVSMLKEENERLVLENSDTREGLHRVNTEMAEMGMTICKLSAEKEEAREQWAADEVRIEEFEKEVERFGECMDELREENKMLKEELAQMEKLPKRIKELQDQLEKANSQVQSLKNSTREEVEAVKFQMSSESMNHQVQIKSLTEQLNKVKTQLQEEQKSVSSLQKQVSQLEALNEQYLQLTGEKDAHITKTEITIRDNDTEIQQLRHEAHSTKDAHLAAQALCDELKHKLETTEVDKQTQILKMSAEIDDLNRTKTILEERLIELIRDKDALWQKTDALEFEQKLRSEERWWLMDKEATHCLGCQGQFTWWLRKHHCRLCGRIFCYYCSNNFVMTKQSGKKERCCKDCYNQHSSVVERFSEAELSPSETQAPSPGPGPQPCPDAAPSIPTPRDPTYKSDDGIFDIITEDEVHRVYDSDAASQTTAGSLDGEQAPRLLNISTGDVTPEEAEEHIPTVQDSEINLLKSGEVTMAIPFSIEDISQFGGGSRELFIKSSNYSVITVTVCDCGATISWMFSSEPKSISFSVVHRESTDTPIEQSKVLIPLTRCNSHKETVQGQLKVRHPGLYTLIFDNSFSRFISKKVFYHLTMEQPIVYDGSDIP
ncbi:FYVE and coiled-coil domain-containing protein 1 [Periophthalmus magnuspinnatus]|uniref:FYVE and coiled-coil domain-containing protein 1 n=1 Tax=Periophthalmus magnuspinnatus TaxID=409849 RepID=UPI00145A0BE7|nr:FYVE and coiled-coil domain-containing protein 1 [Periophthalmus magnuspinnatus]XP_033847921.1 FYVE and coiled-coil domain-containing protein 1 [Periophthalmus magnuspinnatus]